jgi:hypothetical protein
VLVGSVLVSDSASEAVGFGGGALFGERKNSVSTSFDAIQIPPTFRAG